MVKKASEKTVKQSLLRIKQSLLRIKDEKNKHHLLLRDIVNK